MSGEEAGWQPSAFEKWQETVQHNIELVAEEALNELDQMILDELKKKSDFSDKFELLITYAAGSDCRRVFQSLDQSLVQQWLDGSQVPDEAMQKAVIEICLVEIRNRASNMTLFERISELLPKGGKGFMIQLAGEPQRPTWSNVDPWAVIQQLFPTLSTRVKNILKGKRIVYLGQLIVFHEAELFRAPNFGKKSLEEIKFMLESIGTRFGAEGEELEDFRVANKVAPYFYDYDKSKVVGLGRDTHSVLRGSELKELPLDELRKLNAAGYTEVGQLAFADADEVHKVMTNEEVFDDLLCALSKRGLSFGTKLPERLKKAISTPPHQLVL